MLLYRVLFCTAHYFCNNILGQMYCCLSSISMMSLLITCTFSLHVFGYILPNFYTLYNITETYYTPLSVCGRALKLVSSQISCIISAILKNANDIHPNPGPSSNTQKDELHISHLNVQSLLSEISPSPVPHDEIYIKVDEIFKQQVCENSADLITLSETWLGPSLMPI